MSNKGYIRAEDLRDTHLEAFPYFPVDAMMVRGSFDEDADSVASDLDEAKVPVEQRIVDRLQEAERQAHEIARHAYEEGFASGEAEGRIFGESQYKAYIQRLEEELTDLAAITLTLKETLNDELVALALAVGEHLAVQQIEHSPRAVKALMERILEELPFPLPRGRRDGELPLQIFLNPADIEQLGDHYVGHGGIALLGDASLSRGSLRIEAPQGIFNGTLDRRRERLMQLIARMKEGEAP
ncbi:FliH/SctL family protein [Geothrix sp. PMB-07]|uniref:FliH/SctL family protein n=1 Tax=Geothrix sp. PMB-07 TaxID=3068640 RepID=UPI00274277B3|nr:FliH/SctL family protein [Geothrix sp. PMB-07]WLT32463.1 FliH/SctL family protein [Geothrix sp. PMB-07]